MTVSNQTNRTSATGTGAAQTITFLFPIVNNSDISVYKRLTSTGAETLLAETTDYTVTNNGSSGGSITTVNPYISSSYTIWTVRNTAMTQSLDLEQGGSFNAENIEAAVDKNTRLIIENAKAIERCLKIPVTDGSTLEATTEIDNSIDRASKYLYFSTDGSIAVADSVVSPDDATVSTFMATVLDDTTSAAAMATLGGVQVFNVMNAVYGATGDGATDDKAAIQAAIDACESAGGGIVYFPKPTSSYRIESTLTIDSVGVTLWGAMKANIDVIDGVTTAVDIKSSWTNVLGLDFEGSDTTTPTDVCIKISNSSAYSKVEDCRIRYFGKAISLATTNNNKIHYNSISNCKQYIVIDDSGGTTSVNRITLNSFGVSDISTEALVSIDGVNNYVIGNYFETVTTSNKKSSITVSNTSQNIIIADNMFETSGAINCAANFDAVISNNLFKNCAAYVNATDDGVIYVNSASARIIGNVVYEGTEQASIYGIWARGGMISIIGNRVEDFEIGIRASGIPAIIGNAISNCTTGIVTIATTTGARISDNLFSGNTTDISLAGGTGDSDTLVNGHYDNIRYGDVISYEGAVVTYEENVVYNFMG